MGFGFLDAFSLSSGILGPLFSANNHAGLARAQYEHGRAMTRLEAHITAQRMIRAVRLGAVECASGAAALLSASAIDVTVGTAHELIARSFSEAEKEVDRIVRTTLL